MSNAYNTFLNTVCRLVNKPDLPVAPVRINVTSVRFKGYFSLSLLERIEFNGLIEDFVARTESIELIFLPVEFNETPLLKSIVITDIKGFLKGHGVNVTSDIVKSGCALLESASIELPDWAKEQRINAIKNWSAGKQAFGCKPQQANNLVDAFKFVGWMESKANDDSVSMDIRTVSSLLYGTSKRLQAVLGPISRIYAPALPEHLADSNSVTIVEFLGVSKFPPVFPVKGDLLIETRSGSISAGVAAPYVAMPPDGIVKLSAQSQPDYILFIENETTFNRYTREVQDGGWVFFTHGFPSRQWQRLFKQVIDCIEPTVPCYHWGDIDAGGYRILSFMQVLLNVDLIPYLMSPQDAIRLSGEHVVKVIDVTDLSSALAEAKEAALTDLRNEVNALSKTYIPWIEQEHFPIRSVLSQ